MANAHLAYPENWYPQHDQDALLRAAARVSVPGAWVELGSHRGQSAVLLASHFVQTIVCVDIWEYIEGAYESFVANTRGHRIVAAKMTTDEFLRTFATPIAFCHIDASHEYGQVKKDIEGALKLMAPGGIMCGHDYGYDDHPGVKRAVDELLPEATSDSAVWSYAV